MTNNLGPFSYIACGGGSSTDSYSAFTTNPSSRPLIVAPTRPTIPTPPPTGLTFSQEKRETGAAETETETKTKSQPPPANSAANTNASGPNNTVAIISGVVGCLALICVSSVSVVWLRRRYRRKEGSKPPSIHDVAPEPSTTPFEGKQRLSSGISELIGATRVGTFCSSGRASSFRREHLVLGGNLLEVGISNLRALGVYFLKILMPRLGCMTDG